MTYRPYTRIETSPLRAIKLSVRSGQTVILEASNALADMQALSPSHDGDGLFWGVAQGREWAVLVDDSPRAALARTYCESREAWDRHVGHYTREKWDALTPIQRLEAAMAVMHLWQIEE